MCGMSRKAFKINLSEALECKDLCVDNDTLETFLDLNYDEDSSITDWTYGTFTSFVSDVLDEGFWEACRLNDLHTPGEEDYE